jgi:hypothetical protein
VGLSSLLGGPRQACHDNPGCRPFGVALDVIVLGVLATAFLVLGAWAFSRIQV